MSSSILSPAHLDDVDDDYIDVSSTNVDVADIYNIDNIEKNIDNVKTDTIIIDPMHVCRDFMMKRCRRANCRYIHDRDICVHFWRHGRCKFGDACEKKHVASPAAPSPPLDALSEKTQNVVKSRARNTESFEPLDRPVDMRVVVDLGFGPNAVLSTFLTPRDVLLVPGLFADFPPLAIFDMLSSELASCGVHPEKLLKPWHGDTHLIADDKTPWKQAVPTFDMILCRIRDFFRMHIQATRLNVYQDTTQWKPFHHDAAAIKEDKAAMQNFTVAVSFGAVRDAAFEAAVVGGKKVAAGGRAVISMPQPDGSIYAFARDTNVMWKHGILQERIPRNEGRISIIAWGWVDY
jgi:hypothetical protein